MLAKGLGAFEDSDSDELISFIDHYVAKSYGMAFIKKWLSNNKGKNVLEILTTLDIAYTITIVKNHKQVWQRDHFKETFEDEERKNYENYRSLEEENRVNRTPGMDAYVCPLLNLVRGK